jgi:hypothetical protein
MRLTGEDHFCCPAHKRLYHDEHSRLGLARLMEEAPNSAGDEATPPAEELVSDGGRVDELILAEALPEPELVYSGHGLRLWTFPHQPHSFKPRFEGIAMDGLTPAEYTAGRVSPAKPRQTLEVSHRSPKTVGGGAGPLTQEMAPTASRSKEQVEGGSAPDGKQLPVPAQPPATVMVEQPVFSSVETTRAGGYKVAAGVVLALCLGAGGYLGLGIGGAGSSTAAVARSGESILDDWIPNWSETANDGGIALFGPSQEWADYRVQWIAEREKSLAWVFRAADPQNYYSVQIQRVASGDLRLVRYAVVGGARSDLVESSLALPGTGETKLEVELEVRGSRFVLYLDGRSVADWSDDRLPNGGFGVVRPDAGLAEVDDVKVIHLNGQSATNKRFWRGLLPDSMPEVTVLPPAHETLPESEEL